MLNGKGVFTNWNGAIYKGTFKDGYILAIISMQKLLVNEN